MNFLLPSINLAILHLLLSNLKWYFL